MLTKKKLILFLTLCITFKSYSAVPLTGNLELRPSWVPSLGKFHAENQLEATYEFQPKTTLGYVQEFQTQFNQIEEGTSGFELGDGYLKGEFALNDWFEFEPRLFFPTSAVERDSGMVLAVRPIAKLILFKKSPVSWEFWESPIAVLNGENPSGRRFENRVEFGPRANFFEEKLSLQLPLVWQEIRSPAGWQSSLWVSPEVTYAFTDNTALGLSYYTESFTDSEYTFEEALNKGVAQFVFQQSF